MIGILGLGSFSTLHLIKRLNEECNKIYGGYSTCPLILLNVDFNLINPHLPDQFEQLIPVTKSKIEELNNLKVSSIIIPNITLHETIDQIDFTTIIKNKIVHPLADINEILQLRDAKEIIVLGSLFTMKSNYIKGQISQEVNSLTTPEMVKVDDIRKDIYTSSAQTQHISYIQKLVKKYENTTFIIACTELSILFSEIESKCNFIDLFEQQINNSNLSNLK